MKFNNITLANSLRSIQYSCFRLYRKCSRRFTLKSFESIKGNMIETKKYITRGSIGQKNKPREKILNATMSRTLLFMNETR